MGGDFLWKVWDGLADLPGGPGRTGDKSGDPPGCLERVGGPSKSSGTGRGTLPDVWDGSGDPLHGPGRVGGPSRRSGTGQEVLLGVWDWSWDPPRGLGRVGMSF